MRKVGKQIRAVLEMSDKAGEFLKAYDLFRMAGMEAIPTSRVKVCRRACLYGLMEADNSVYPARFKSLPGWRNRIEMSGISKGNPKPREVKQVSKVPDRIPRVANSVFSLGGML